MTRIFAVVVCVVLSSGLALTLAQGEAPKPGPEHKKLGYFVGSWVSSGEMMPNPFFERRFDRGTRTDRRIFCYCRTALLAVHVAQFPVPYIRRRCYGTSLAVATALAARARPPR